MMQALRYAGSPDSSTFQIPGIFSAQILASSRSTQPGTVEHRVPSPGECTPSIDNLRFCGTGTPARHCCLCSNGEECLWHIILARPFRLISETNGSPSAIPLNL